MLPYSKDWNLCAAKYVISEIKEIAWLDYDWKIQKDDIEEVIMIMDSDYRIYGSLYSAARAAIKDQWNALKEKASRELYLALIREEVEMKGNDKKLTDQAI